MQNLGAITFDQAQLYGTQRARMFRPVPIPHPLYPGNGRSDMDTDENMDTQPPALHCTMSR